MKQLITEIASNKEMTGGFYRMRLKSAYLAGKSLPGQFIEVRCSDGYDTLLRRPFGVHRVVKGGIEILYEVVGRGTDLLSRKKIGDSLDVIGPLGRGFKLAPAKGAAIIVAGGNGVAPLLALVERLVHGKRKNIFVLIGAKNKNHILCRDEFKKLGAKVMISTEDGSDGRRGLITNCLSSLLSTMDCGPSTIYACGPAGMLKVVANIASREHIPCQVSLEERMACGVGVCLGCPVKIKTKHKIRATKYELRI